LEKRVPQNVHVALASWNWSVAPSATQIPTGLLLLLLLQSEGMMVVLPGAP
jgi:hypothetical protein